MKLGFTLFLACLVCFAAANWSQEDYEIFNLNDKVRQDLGPETTFYSWLGLTKGPKSTVDEIAKAYRKLSRKTHPDKYRGKSRAEKKKAEERFQTLSLVSNILRDQSLRQRYDFFLQKGFPKWKGTGYYYSRFRPGFGLTLFVLYVLISGLQYVSLKINRKQDYKRIAQMKEEIKLQAWGGSYIPPLDGSARKVDAANGNEFHISPTGDVSLMEKDKDGNVVLSLVDENDIDVNPGIKDSFFCRIPCGIWNLTVGKLTGYTIDTTVTFVNTKRKEATPEVAEKKTKKKPKGKKIELPNGKVIYSRNKK